MAPVSGPWAKHPRQAIDRAAPIYFVAPHQTRTPILCNPCRTGLQDDALKECQTRQGEHPTEASVEECAKNLAKEMKESMPARSGYWRFRALIAEL